jgi:hypothetical protein
MPDSQAVGLEQELQQAFDALHEALQRAAEATTALRDLAPRVSAIGGVFDQIEAAVNEGRRQIAGATRVIAATPSAVPEFPRPTLVVPVAAAAAAPARPQPFAPPPAEALPHIDCEMKPAAASAPATVDVIRNSVAREVPHVAFRLEFESHPGPLDLRAVDDAISEHPAVRDIALLDYDGHKATLKVWNDGDTSPSSIQVAIRDRVRALFSSDNDVTVVALEDAA